MTKHVPRSLFARLRPTIKHGDPVRLRDWPGITWYVDTARVADDGHDAKCVLIPEHIWDERGA